MAVVINEFEVIPGEQPPPQQGSASSPGAQESAAPPAEHEIERMVEHQRERYGRVWAH